MRILITGSRTWTHTHIIYAAMYLAADLAATPVTEPPTIVHGACPEGADHIADTIATGMGWKTEPHPADWKRYGNRAGPIRNREMVQAGADVCLAFIHNNSKGASMCANLAEQAGIPVIRYQHND